MIFQLNVGEKQIEYMQAFNTEYYDIEYADDRTKMDFKRPTKIRILPLTISWLISETFRPK